MANVTTTVYMGSAVTDFRKLFVRNSGRTLINRLFEPTLSVVVAAWSYYFGWPAAIAITAGVAVGALVLLARLYRRLIILSGTIQHLKAAYDAQRHGHEVQASRIEQQGMVLHRLTSPDERTKYDRAMEQQRARLDASLETYRADLKTEIQANRSELERAVEHLKSESETARAYHKRSLELQRAEFQAGANTLLNELEHWLSSQISENEATWSRHKALLAAQQQESRDLLASVQSSIDQVRQQQVNQIDETNRKLTAQQQDLAGLASNLQASLAEMRKVVEAQMQSANESTAVQHEHLGAELGKLKSAIEGLKTTYGTQFVSMEARVAEALMLSKLEPHERRRVEQQLTEAIDGTAGLKSIHSDFRLLRNDLNAVLRDTAAGSSPKLPTGPVGTAMRGKDNDKTSPEIVLAGLIADVVSAKTAVDVGAHIGVFSDMLAGSGLSVTAFEPNPSLNQKLVQRFRSTPQVNVLDCAVSDKEGSASLRLYVGVDSGGEIDTQLSSLIEHPTYPGLDVAKEIPVKTVRLATLAKEGRIPREIGFLKIDTEGHDLAVLRGLGPLKPEVICVEFWNKNFVFNSGATENDLPDYRKFFEGTDYRWNIALYRPDPPDGFAVRVQASGTPFRSWGNIFFFRDERQFEAALAALAARYGASIIERV